MADVRSLVLQMITAPKDAEGNALPWKRFMFDQGIEAWADPDTLGVPREHLAKGTRGLATLDERVDTNGDKRLFLMSWKVSSPTPDQEALASSPQGASPASSDPKAHLRLGEVVVREMISVRDGYNADLKAVRLQDEDGNTVGLNVNPKYVSGPVEVGQKLPSKIVEVPGKEGKPSWNKLEQWGEPKGGGRDKYPPRAPVPKSFEEIHALAIGHVIAGALTYCGAMNVPVDGIDAVMTKAVRGYWTGMKGPVKGA